MPIEGNQMNVDAPAAPVRDPDSTDSLDMLRARLSDPDRDIVKTERKPDGPTPRQLEQTNAEIEAGRRRSAFFAEQQRLVAEKKLPGVAVPTENELKARGQSTPVFVPEDYQHEKGIARGKGVSSGKL